MTGECAVASVTRTYSSKRADLTAVPRAVGVIETSPLFELTRVLVRFDHVASLIVNANHSIM